LSQNGDSAGFWLSMAKDDELPYLQDDGYYKNINIIRFEVPEADKLLLTKRVLEAGKYLILAEGEAQDNYAYSSVLDYYIKNDPYVSGLWFFINSDEPETREEFNLFMQGLSRDGSGVNFSQKEVKGVD
jgi:hypothetical protein